MLNSLNENLNLLMAKVRISSDELARQINIPATTIKRIRNNEHANPTISTLIPIAKFFSISLDQLTGIKPLTNLKNKSPGNMQEIPLLSWREIINYIKIKHIERSTFISVEKIVSEKAFSLIVEDDDLVFFPKNCILIVDPAVQALNGDYIIVTNIKSNIPTIRKYIVEMDQIYLKSLISGIGIVPLTLEYKILGVILQYKVELKQKSGNYNAKKTPLVLPSSDYLLD